MLMWLAIVLWFEKGVAVLGYVDGGILCHLGGVDSLLQRYLGCAYSMLLLVFKCNAS